MPFFILYSVPPPPKNTSEFKDVSIQSKVPSRKVRFTNILTWTKQISLLFANQFSPWLHKDDIYFVVLHVETHQFSGLRASNSCEWSNILIRITEEIGDQIVHHGFRVH